MRILIARCEIAYHGRATTRLGAGDRVILFKDDGSLCVHAEKGYKPLNSNFAKARRVAGRDEGSRIAGVSCGPDYGHATTYDPGMRMQTRFVGIALIVLAAGCAGGGAGHHPTLTVAQALRQARSDGFLAPVRVADPGSLRCDKRTLEFGPTQTTGRYAAYQRPGYALELGDRRTPPRADDTARVGMEVWVFRSARFAARCAHGGIYAEEHFPVNLGSAKLLPYRAISSTTVELGMHKAGAPGTVRGQTGEYDTYVTDGRVFATGVAYNTHDSQIVQADLAQIADEIAG
jgi:hypothetical protein